MATIFWSLCFAIMFAILASALRDLWCSLRRKQ